MKISQSALPPLSLYLHLPWCEQKCPYCDFNSHALRYELQEQEYLEALLIDIDQEQGFLTERPLHSVFIGGGTPSLFSSVAIEQLLGTILELAGGNQQIEITLEANPSSAEAERFAGYRKAGVTRLSIGVQSFSNRSLGLLGRVHDKKQAVMAIAAAREAGFSNLNLDLMFSLPGQDENGALDDLETALRFEPNHLSLYQLTIEPNTRFAIDRPVLPDEETDWLIRSTVYDRVAAAGYQRYEVSAFSQPNQHCQHNLNIWQFGDYLGIGAGAHGKVTTPEGVIRYTKERHPNRYMEKAVAGSALAQSRVILPDDLRFEFMLNALRLVDGFTPAKFTERTGLPRTFLDEQLDDAYQRGLLDTTEGRIRATEFGYRFLDDLVQLFLPKKILKL